MRSRRLETVASLQIAGAVWLDIYSWDTFSLTEPLAWPFSALVWFTPFYWLLRSPDSFGALRRLPLATLGLWAVWFLIAVNWSNDVPPALGFSLGVLSTMLAAAWFAGTFGWRKLARVVAVTIAVFALAGLLHRGVTGDFFGEDGRFVGLGNNPTDTGRHAVVMALAGISGFRGDRRLQQLFVALGAVVTVLAVAKTAMIGLTVGLLYIGYRSGRSRTRLAVATVAAALVLGAGALVTSLTAAPVRSPGSATGPVDTASALTLTGRVDLWADTLELVAQRPLTGWGTGSSTIVYADLRGDGWLGWEVTTAHNLWVHSLLEHGVVGAGLFVITAISLAACCRRRPDAARDAILIWLLLNSVTEALIQYPGLPLVIIAGVAGVFTYPRPSNIDGVLAGQPDRVVPVARRDLRTTP